MNIRKIYIDSNFEHLLASNFTESIFLKCSNAYKIFKKSLSCPTYASTAPVPNDSTDNQYGTSTGRPVQNIVIIPDICQHCARTCQYGRSATPVVNFLLGKSISKFHFSGKLYKKKKKVMIQNRLLHKDLQVWTRTFVHKMYIFLFN